MSGRESEVNRRTFRNCSETRRTSVGALVEFDRWRSWLTACLCQPSPCNWRCRVRVRHSSNTSFCAPGRALSSWEILLVLSPTNILAPSRPLSSWTSWVVHSLSPASCAFEFVGRAGRFGTGDAYADSRHANVTPPSSLAKENPNNPNGISKQWWSITLQIFWNKWQGTKQIFLFKLTIWCYFPRDVSEQLYACPFFRGTNHIMIFIGKDYENLNLLKIGFQPSLSEADTFHVWYSRTAQVDRHNGMTFLPLFLWHSDLNLPRPKAALYGPHMGCIWAAYGLPICFGRSSDWARPQYNRKTIRQTLRHELLPK